MADSPNPKPVFSFPAMEQEILRLWEKQDTFRESMRQNALQDSFVFFDGPPFATGLPHHGNLLASVIKDIVPRYWTMKGRYVQRRFGWDCHGLPIEHEINKKLGLQAHEAVKKLGIAGYNQECRSIVERYVKDWRQIITRLGRWVDFDDDYKTMDVDFMESVWWVVKALWDKGLVYRGNKVMPVSTGLETPLSNFEAGMNYMDVQDPSITVLFALKEDDAFVSTWTTTPWTLPSNLALCVGDEIMYVLVHETVTNRKVYLAEERLNSYSTNHNLIVLKRVRGKELVGREYEPLFPYFAHLKDKGAFRIVSDAYVKTDEGTGVVQQAPAFGEDDYRIAQLHGVPTHVCPVTMSGHFTEEVVDFSGIFIKEADTNIIAWLKRKNRVFEHTTLQHSYPYCYRSQTPLIYRAVPSWFVRIAEFRDLLLRSNREIRWVPKHIQNGRMGNWLENANDWCISRNRVWGTPVPIWENDVTGSLVCIGSRQELQKYTGADLEDLHREFVDSQQFQLKNEEGVYRRVPEVLDCWFESGSMPYAQSHYPFDHKEQFERGFPADFIAEGLDQTRGWFYTLIALSTLLFQKPAFKNVIVNGLVLAADGKKMSKSLRNYTDPELLMRQHGADALRLYLINSGLVRGEEQRFADSGVREMTRRALLPWHNAFSFLQLYAKIDGWTAEKAELTHANILDQWILSRLQTMKSAITFEMERYRLDNVVPQLFVFIEELTNWYIRLNRSRFWGTGLDQDKVAAYSTLYLSIKELTLALAPCAPFLAEHIYQQLSELETTQHSKKSVHLCSYPLAEQSLRNQNLEEAVSRLQQIVLLGRKQREEQKISLRTPLSRLTVIHKDHDLLADVQKLEHYIKKELNVKKVLYDQNESDYIEWTAKPNFPVLGKRLGKRMRTIQQLVQQLTSAQLENFQSNGSIVLDEESFTLDEIHVYRRAKAGSSVVSDRLISIEQDLELTAELKNEGIAREIVHRIQLARKELDFQVTDRIRVDYQASPNVMSIVQQFEEYIGDEVLAVEFCQSDDTSFRYEWADECFEFGLTQMSR